MADATNSATRPRTGSTSGHPPFAVVVTSVQPRTGLKLLMEALAGQTGLRSRSIMVFAAVGDRLSAAAAAFEAIGDGALELHLFEGGPAPTRAADSRKVLEAAAYRLRRYADGADPVLLVLDAEVVPAPDWVENKLRALEAGADLVCGCPQPACHSETGRLPPSLDALMLHRRLVARLEELLDPVPWDPVPRHVDESGASIALSLSTLASAGGVPDVPADVHRHLIARVRQSGGTVRHCPRSRVFVPPRALAGLDAEWQPRDAQRPVLVSDPHELERHFRDRARLRGQLNRDYSGLRRREQDRAVRSHLALRTAAVATSPRTVPVEDACWMLRKRLEQLGAPCGIERTRPGAAPASTVSRDRLTAR